MSVPFVDAMKTDLGRHMDARALAEGVVVADWFFKVGSGGHDTGDPERVEVVDPTLQTMVAAVGSNRYLGLVVSSGSGATVAAGSEAGQLVVSGLSGMSEVNGNRWLRLAGSANTAMNGTWLVSEWLSASSVAIYNPLVESGDLPDAGPMTWELRRRCIQNPNARAAAHYCRILPGVVAAGTIISEVGVFGRVVRAPSDPSILGTELLYGVAHVAPKIVVPEMTWAMHVCVQS